MNNVWLVSLFVILFTKINFVYLSPIVGGIVPANHGTCILQKITKISPVRVEKTQLIKFLLPLDDFSFSVSLQVRNDTETTTSDGGTTVGNTGIPDYKHFCGGTYLKNGWILTASHCVIQM